MTKAVAASEAREVKAAVVLEGSRGQIGPVEAALLVVVTLVGGPARASVAFFRAPELKDVKIYCI